MLRFNLRRVNRETYKPRPACLYVIGHPYIFDSLEEVLRRIVVGEPNIYVGVTEKEIKKRWKDHKAFRSSPTRPKTCEFIREHGYDFEDCFSVLAEGTMNECLKLEYHLRPEPGMGLNKAAGGLLKHRKSDPKILELLEF